MRAKQLAASHHMELLESRNVALSSQALAQGMALTVIYLRVFFGTKFTVIIMPKTLVNHIFLNNLA